MWVNNCRESFKHFWREITISPSMWSFGGKFPHKINEVYMNTMDSICSHVKYTWIEETLYNIVLQLILVGKCTHKINSHEVYVNTMDSICTHMQYTRIEAVIVQYHIDVDFGRKCTNKINTREVYMNKMDRRCTHENYTKVFSI